MGNGIFATDYANPTPINYERGADLTGNADGSKGICSFWIFPVPTAQFTQIIYGVSSPTTSNLIQYFPPFAAVRFGFDDGLGGNSFFMFNQFGTTTAGVWQHYLASWDLTVPILHLYKDNVVKIGTNAKTVSTIDYTVLDHAIGDSVIPAGFHLESCISEFYFAPNQFLDFSIASNRQAFIDLSGNPVELGPTGALPTGTAPLIYLPDGDGATNAGTGGTFVLGGPAPVPCATTPNVIVPLTPSQVIEEVRDEVNVEKIAETDDFIRSRLDFGEDNLTDALSKLDAGDLRKTAKAVRKSVKFLEKAVEKGFSDATVDDWGERLCGAIREIADDEITAAIGRTGDPVKIAEAQDAFADGDIEKLFAEFLEAIRDYEKAIKSAIVA